jgi:hypothetical protein
MPIKQDLVLQLATWLENKTRCMSTAPDIQVFYGQPVSVNILARTDRQAMQSAHEFTKALWEYPDECTPYLDLDFEILANGKEWGSFNLGEVLTFNGKP